MKHAKISHQFFHTKNKFENPTTIISPVLNSCSSKTMKDNLHGRSASFKLKYSKTVCRKYSILLVFLTFWYLFHHYEEEYFRYCDVSRS